MVEQLERRARSRTTKFSSENSEEPFREVVPYLPKLIPYVQNFSHYAEIAKDPTLPTDSPLHPKQMRKTGTQYRHTRTKLGLPVEDVAQRLGVRDPSFGEPTLLVAFEMGLVPSTELPPGYLSGLQTIFHRRKTAPKTG